MDFIKSTKLYCDTEIAKTLFIGLVADSNRFLFDSSTDKTFSLVAHYLKNYPFSINEVYQRMYLRPLAEVRLEGYIEENMTLTEHGVAYIKITDDIICKMGVDSAAAGNMVNNFNFIEGIYVWLTITEDVKNELIRVSIRSRGPEINQVAEKHNGGGHKYASGVKFKTFDEAMKLIDDLDLVTKKYLDNKED